MATARTIDRPALSLVDKKPTDQQIVAEYKRQFLIKPRGAVLRTAKALGSNHTHVGNVVERHGYTDKKVEKAVKQLERDKTVLVVGDPWDYEPCPGEHEVRESHAQIAAELSIILEQTAKPIETPPEIVQEIATPSVIETVAVPRLEPLQLPPIAKPPVQLPDPPTMTVAETIAKDTEWTFCAILSIALVFTAAALVFATKSLGWSLVWLGFAMFCWWQTVGAWREWNCWRGPPRLRLHRTNDPIYDD